MIESRLSSLELGDKVKESRITEIIKHINEKDSTGLKAMFSKNAVSQAVDIDDKIESMFEYIQGEIIEWEIDDVGFSSSISQGKKMVEWEPEFI